ncbi:hypothetical protein PTKIN_Ptkin05aG0186300 [Pterospermum kingtungense]
MWSDNLAKMNLVVFKVGRSRSFKLPKEKVFEAEEIHMKDNKLSELRAAIPKRARSKRRLGQEKKKELTELQTESPDYASYIACYLSHDLAVIPPLVFQRILLLQVLDLSDTNIKSLPKSLPRLVALRKLLLRRCKLFMELPPLIGKLENLEELDLAETQIMDLPREIGELAKLRYLRVSLYGLANHRKRWLQSNIVIRPETISNLSQLTELSIDVDPTDKRWDDSVEAVVKEVGKLKGLRSLSLYLPRVQLLNDFSSNGKSLSYPSFSCFRFIVGYHKRRIISRVPHEVEAQFTNGEKCLKFVKGGDIPIEIKGVLRYSTSFFLDNHATALNLSEFGIENMKRLTFCLLAECNKMETIIDGKSHNKGDEKVDPSSAEHVLESLQYLSIYYMKNLRSIWRGPTPYGSLSKLKFLALHTCPRLSSIFSQALLESLVNLEELILEDCPQVTSLVSPASIKPMWDDFLLPSLKRLLLVYLPELVSISNGLLIAPELESIGFYNCPKLKSISKTELSSKTLKKIKGESQWWGDIKWNEADWGPRLGYLLHIFSPISNDEDVMTQLVEDRDLSVYSTQKEGQLQDTINLSCYNKDEYRSSASFLSQFAAMDMVSTISPPYSRPPEQERSPQDPLKQYDFSSEKNKTEEDDYFDLTSEICEPYVDEDEPQAKRWLVKTDLYRKMSCILGLINDTHIRCYYIWKDENENEGIIVSESKAVITLENSLLGPESDITDSCNSCCKSGALQVAGMASFNRAQLVEMIPRLDLKQVLVGCGKAVSDSDMWTAAHLMHILEQMVSVSGEPIQRLGAYVLEALRARLESSGSNIYKALRCKEPTSSELLSYMHIFYKTSPYWKFAYISANVVIKEVMENEQKIHIIDFQIAQGTQWTFLIPALAKRRGGPPFIRITGFDDSNSNHARGGGLSIVGQRLSKIAESYNVQFEFHDGTMYGSEVELEHLRVQPGESLAVNFPFVLHHFPDESVSLKNHRDRMLRLVKTLSPKVVTLVEQELNTNTTPFFARFLETLDYYTAFFESIDVEYPRDDKLRIRVEQNCVASLIVNAIACEGLERVERNELFGKWRSRFMMAGFSAHPLSSSASVAIKDLLKEYDKNFRLEEREGALFLGWGNRALATSSAWR